MCRDLFTGPGARYKLLLNNKVNLSQGFWTSPMGAVDCVKPESRAVHLILCSAWRPVWAAGAQIIVSEL